MNVQAPVSHSMDKETFLRLRDGVLPLLYKKAKKFFNRIPDIEDVVQDTILRAWGNRNSFEGYISESEPGNGIPFGVWTGTILRNICIDRLRRMNTQPDLQAGDSEFYNVAVRPNQAGFVAGHDLQQAMKKLSSQQQQLIKLRYVQGLSAREITKIVPGGLGEHAVETQLSRARIKIRKTLSAGPQRM